MFNRCLKVGGLAVCPTPVPNNTMRNDESTTQEEEEGQEHLCAV
jgi:hypothetical protein